MYIDERHDKCDLCETVMQAGNFMHGGPGSNPLYLTKDICFKCADKRNVGNCSMCATIHENSVLDSEYMCPKCSKVNDVSAL